MKAEVLQAEVLEWAASYDGPPFHALLTDPPYHLTSIVDRLGGGSKNETAHPNLKRFQRGFMGQTWDGGDLAFQPETWAAFGKHLHPGAFGFAFASSRGWHRMAVAIEDAGFVMHPTIFCWALWLAAGADQAESIAGLALDRRREVLLRASDAISSVLPAECLS